MDVPRGTKRPNEDGNTPLGRTANTNKRRESSRETCGNTPGIPIDGRAHASRAEPPQVLHVLDGEEVHDIEECDFEVQFEDGKKDVHLRKYCIPDDKSAWLVAIPVFCTFNGKVIGSARAKLVQRDSIRHGFWQKLRLKSSEMFEMAVIAFDHNGFLQTHWKDHFYRRGTGVWQSELDSGPLLFIEQVHVFEQAWRRRNIAKKMLDFLLKRAHAWHQRTLPFDNGVLHAIAKPGWLKDEILPRWKGKDHQQQQIINTETVKAAAALFRSVGFRRIGISRCFGYSFDLNHASRKIVAADDCEIPLQDCFNGEIERGFLQTYYSLFASTYCKSDSECVSSYESFAKKPHPSWNQVGPVHETLLHAAANRIKPKSLAWLLKHVPGAHRWMLIRDGEGCTPLEILQERMEYLRSFEKAWGIVEDISHKFTGSSSEVVSCFCLLTEVKEQRLSPVQRLRIKYGCTCGACVGGVMSPRMRYSLELSARRLHKQLLQGPQSKTTWTAFLESKLKGCTAPQRQKISNDETIRRGFIGMFAHVASCLESNQIPIEENVLPRVKKADKNEKCPHATEAYTKFVDFDGVDYVVMEVVEGAKETDEIVGNGNLQRKHGRTLAGLTTCRNDHEFLLFQRVYDPD